MLRQFPDFLASHSHTSHNITVFLYHTHDPPSYRRHKILSQPRFMRLAVVLKSRSTVLQSDLLRARTLAAGRRSHRPAIALRNENDVSSPPHSCSRATLASPAVQRRRPLPFDVYPHSCLPYVSVVSPRPSYYYYCTIQCVCASVSNNFVLDFVLIIIFTNTVKRNFFFVYLNIINSSGVSYTRVCMCSVNHDHE